MHFWPQLSQFFADPRLKANLVAFYGLAMLIVSLAMLLRRHLRCPPRQEKPNSQRCWRRAMRDEVKRHARRCLFWATLLALVATVGAGIFYHAGGWDVREHFGAWYSRMTMKELREISITLTVLFVLMIGTEVSIWILRRLRPRLQQQAHGAVGCQANADSLCRCFVLVERYSVWAMRLAALWGAAFLVGFGDLATGVIGFVLRVMTIVMAARLLTLTLRTLSHKAVDWGDTHLSKGHFRRYWERISRLYFPFGERCFQAAVYVSAASLCVRELHFIAFVADYGPRVVHCIGILFGTRVLIELSQVVLNEAFGLYDDTRHLDAKGRTLVPLLHSICQYTMYFGSAVVMLGMLGMDTRPILAGAGILGLAVGLGAQSLVTDVVSGFFILFENQYLVGDYVQVGDAVGTVEAVSIRLTQIRDGHGKLHMLPNGQIKGVVNYSKGHVNAVVDVRVPTGEDLEDVFRAMADAGRRLQEEHTGVVLAETQVQGLVDLGTDLMTIRAVTRVQPGNHGSMQSEYRRLLKKVFDEQKQGYRTRVAA